MTNETPVSNGDENRHPIKLRHWVFLVLFIARCAGSGSCPHFRNVEIFWRPVPFVRPNELAWRIVDAIANANENFRVLIERFVDLKWKYFEVRLGSNLALSVNRFVSVELIIIIIFSSLLFPLRSAIADQQQSIRCRWQNLRKCVYCLLHTYFDYFRFIWFVRS